MSVWNWPQILHAQRHWSLTQLEKPNEEPVTLDEAKSHLRVTYSDDDNYITALITAARQHAEQFTQRAFVTQKLRLTLDVFPYYILLPRPPCVTVDTIKYADGDGIMQTLDPSGYQVDSAAEPARISAAYGKIFPATRYQLSAVTVDYTAGFGTAADVDDAIKHAMLMIIGTLYENREDQAIALHVQELPVTSKTLLWPYRMLYDM